MSDTNPYRPMLMRIAAIVEETPDVRTFRLVFTDEEEGRNFRFQAGQFGLYSVFGEGESAFCIASPPTRSGYIECSFRQTGRVTGALAGLETGDTIGFRGPYGNAFPIDEWKGKNLLFVAGGIALPPVRCVIWSVLDRRDLFGNVTVVYGARTVADLVYKRELDAWGKRSDMRLVTTVDPGGETPDWRGEIGFVPTVLEKAEPSSADAVSVVCGPPVMIKVTFPVLKRLGFAGDSVFTTLENRMKCGIGKCGRCNVGEHFVCKEGPVFTLDRLNGMPPEY